MSEPTRATSAPDPTARSELAGALSPGQWLAILLLTTVCVGASIWSQAPLAAAAAVTLLAAIGATAAAVDMACHRLPDQLTALLTAATLAAASAHSIATTSLAPVVQTIGGMALVFIVMALLVAVGSGIGGGDLKFSAAASGAPALVLGVAGAGLGLAAGLLLVGVAAVLARTRGQAVVVFGPGLFAGALMVALIGLVEV